MSVALRLPRLGLLHLLEDLIASHPVARFGPTGAGRGEQLAEEVLTRMPAHLREDAGLPVLPAQEPEHPALTEARTKGRNWG